VKVRFVLLVTDFQNSHYPHAFDLEASIKIEDAPIGQPKKSDTPAK
jgi:hypothetical protein